MPRGTKKTPKKKPRAGKPRKATVRKRRSSVDYAKVPKQFEPMFARAQDFVSNYFADLKGDASKGTIEAGGERYLLVRAASMSVDFFKTIKDLYKGVGEEEALDIARNLLFDIAHSIGKADAKSFHKKMKLDDPVDRLSAGPIHFAYSGWAFVDIFPESRPTPDENYYLVYDHPYSFESAAWLKAKKKSGCPVCTMNAGYSSGWCEESFGVTLVAKEIMCKAAGDEACRFIMAPPSKIEAHIQKYLKKKPALLKKLGAYEMPGFFKRKQIEKELRESEDQFRLVFENANDAIFWADPLTGNITNCNKAAERLLEKTKDQIIGQHQTSVHPPDKAQFFAEMFKRYLKENGASSEEAEVITASGVSKPVEINRSITSVGDKQIVQGIFRDITERKKTEESLRQEKGFTEKVIESLTHPFYVINASDYTIRMANKAAGFGKLTGASTCYELTHGRKTPCSESDSCPLEKVKKTKKPAVVEHQHCDEKGVARYYEVQGYPIFDSDGNVVQMIEYMLDITERKKAERELRESKLFTENALNTITDIFYTYDLNGKLLFWNEACSKISGYSDKEMITMKPTDFFSGENAKDIVGAIDRIFEEGTATQEAFLAVKNGKKIPYEFTGSVLKDSKGNAAGFCGVGRDITERKCMENELRAARNNMEQRVELRTAELKRSQRLYQTLAEAAEDYIFIIRSDMTVQYINEFGAKALKCSKDEVIGKKLSALFPSVASDRMEGAVERVFSSGEAVLAENPLQFPDGEVWLHSHLVPLKNGQGEVTGVMGLSRDITKRRGYEERLRLTQTTMDHVGNAIYWMGPDARFIYVNDQACIQLGYDRAELLRMSVHDIDPNIPREAWQQHWREVKEKKSFLIESEHKRKDGVTFPVEVMVNYLEQSGGEYNCAIVLDITERKKSEEELRKLAAIVKYSSELVNLSTPDGKMIFLNEAGSKMLGIDPEKVECMNIMDVIPGNWVDLVESDLLPTLMRGDVWEGDLQYKNLKNGRLTDVHAMSFSIKDPDTEKILFLANASIDITERKKMDEALKESEGRFQQIAENAEEWIWEVNEYGLYTYSNEVVEEILGYKAEEMVGLMHFYDLFIPEDREALKRGAFEVFESKERFKGFVNVNVHKDGRNVILETSGSPIIDKNGNMIGYRGMDTDISERKKAEEELRRAIKLKSDFVAMMSHELRTPLTRIISSTHLVLRDRDAVLSDKRLNNLNNVLSSSDALLLMINNVLEMARLEGGSVLVVNQECDLRHMVRTSISGCEGMTEEKDIKFVINIDDAVATVYTDKEKLSHIIMNLICNAIRYSDEGTVEITAKPSRIQGCADVAVSDKGIGISPEKIPDLFEPFKQLEEISKRRPGGIGLGLAIVKANLELIGGSIDVNSEVGKGSTFTVTIPNEPSQENDKG